MLAGEAELSVGGVPLSGPVGASELDALFAPLIADARGYRTGDSMLLPGSPPIPEQIRIVSNGEQVWPLRPEANIWTAFDSALWQRVRARTEAGVRRAGWSDSDDGRRVIVRIGCQNHIDVVE